VACNPVVVLTICFVMAQFAFVAMGVLPFMAFGRYMQRAKMFGSDEGDIEKSAAQSSDGAVVIETFVNIRIVASLCMEEERVQRYRKALEEKHKNTLCRNTLEGTSFGLGSFFRMWGKFVCNIFCFRAIGQFIL